MVRMVCGVGINDADYAVATKINGRQELCPFYKKWHSMLVRCYSPKYQATRPTYLGCTVCDEWLTFSNFKRWMKAQDWKGKHLDKDILIEGNKEYSAQACAFVDTATNAAITDSTSIRGDLPLGVAASRGRYMASCSSNGRLKNLGRFETPDEAHKAYKDFKSKALISLATKQKDLRVCEALLRIAAGMVAPSSI